MPEKFSSLEQENNFSVFNEYLPGAQIEKRGIGDLPPEVLEYFEFKSHQLIRDEDYKPGNFEKVFRVRFPDGKISYLAQQTKIYATSKETERLTYIADFEEGKISGVAELRFGQNYPAEKEAYFKDKPFVGWIETKGEKGKGAGTRRLYLMNAVSEMLYGLPLYSDTLNSDPMKNLWETLVEQGKAKKFKEGQVDRYVLLGKEGGN